MQHNDLAGSIYLSSQKLPEMNRLNEIHETLISGKKTSILKMREVAGSLRRRFIALRYLGSEYKVEIEAKIWSRWKQSNFFRT